MREREIINKKFLMNPKAVYRKFKADKDRNSEPTKYRRCTNILEKRNNLVKKPIGSQDLRKSTVYECTTSKV